jgi:hypothetical protein
VVAVAAVLVRRPTLWITALVQLAALAPSGWWRRPPFLPAPDAAFLRFRLQTYYGDPDREPEPADALAWLEWCRQYRQVTR